MALVAENIAVRIGNRRLLDDVSLKLAPGELVFLLGPNGAGKTTLLRTLAGLVPASGRVHWKEGDLARMNVRERARLMAYVPQGHIAHWPITTREVVAIGRFPHASSLSRLSPTDAAAIDRALAAADAQHLADRIVTELSGGERARVMLARALAVEAPVLLADEPIAALDPEHQIGMAQLMRQLAHDGRAVLAVVHDLTLASRFGDRVVVLDGGRMIANGEPLHTLTPDLLQQVFGIKAEVLNTGSAMALVPWSTSSRAPNRFA